MNRFKNKIGDVPSFEKLLKCLESHKFSTNKLDLQIANSHILLSINTALSIVKCTFPHM